MENYRSLIDEEEPQEKFSKFWKTFKTRSRYYVPILRWLPKYDFHQDFVHDLLAGITVSLLLIPQSLSYASSLAQLEPVYGLYTSFIPIIVYGIFGTSRQIGIGPEALISLLVGNVITENATKNDMAEHVAIAAALSLIVGVLTFLLGLARLGFIDSVLSRALLRGFISAVACVIVIEQLPKLLGLTIEHPELPPDERGIDSPFSKLLLVLNHLHSFNWRTALISFIAITFLLGFSKVKMFMVKRFGARRSVSLGASVGSLAEMAAQSEYESFPAEPGQAPLAHDTAATNTEYASLPLHLRILVYIPDILIVVVLSILLSYTIGFHANYNVDILGDAALNGGFKLPVSPRLSYTKFRNLLTPAILITILGFVESIVIAKNYSSKHNYPVSANRELVAFGSVNLLGSLLNCWPAFGSIARSRVNDAAGARTQLAGIITAVIILFTILFFLPVFYHLPRAVMGSIVLVAAAALLEFEDVHFMWRIRAWMDLGLMMLTFLITIFWSVEAGTLIAISLSLVLVVKHSTAPKISILVKVVEADNRIKYKPLHEIFQNPGEAATLEDMDILIVRIEEGLFFANTGQLKDRLRRAEVYGGWIHVHPSEEERRKPVGPSSSTASQLRVRSKKSQDPSRPLDIGSPPLHMSSSTANSSPSNSFPTRFLVQLGLQQPTISLGTDADELLREQHDSETTPVPHMTQEHPQLRAVIFDIENMPDIDASAIQILCEIVQEFHSRNVEVCFVKLREANKSVFLRSTLLGDVVKSDHFFRKISEAVVFLREKWRRQERKVEIVVDQPGLNDMPAATAQHVETSGFSTYSVL